MITLYKLSIKGSLTKSKLIDAINSFLSEHYKDRSLEVMKLYHTRYRSQDYESGAYKMVINIAEHGVYVASMNSSYNINELKQYLENGYDLRIASSDKFYTLNSLEIELIKK